MATKTITIDTEAYDRLKIVQQENESFSQTIKRVVPRPISTEDLIALFHQAGSGLSEGFFRGIEGALAARKTIADKERIDGLLGYNRPSGSLRAGRSAKATCRRGKAKAA